MLTITPAATIPEIIREKFTTTPAANNHGYTSAFYAIDTKNKYKYLIEVLTGPLPLYVITAADQYTKYIICFEQNSPRTIDIKYAEVYKTGSRDSVNKAATTEKAPGRPETSTPAQDTTGSETRPPRAADKPTKAAPIIATNADKQQTTRPGAKTPGPAATRHAGTAGKGPPAPAREAPQAPQRTESSKAAATTNRTRKGPPRERETAKRPPAATVKSFPQRRSCFFQDHHKIESAMWKDTRLCGYRVDNPPK